MEDIIIDKDKLLTSFTDIESMINLVILKCYYVLFTKDGLLNNIGSYVLISIIVVFIISAFVFYFKGYNSLLRRINKIISERNNKKNNNCKTYSQQVENQSVNINNCKKYSKQVANSSTNLNIKKRNNYKKNAQLSVNLSIKRKNNVKNVNNNAICLSDNNKFISKIDKTQKNFPPKKKKINSRGSLNSRSHIKLDINETNNFTKSSKKKLKKPKNIKIVNLEDTKTKNPKENNNTNLVLNDYETNILSYNEALKYDKRTYYQYYLSLLRTKHPFIFAFFQKNDYNSQIIKICLFFFSFALYYTINALFFTDETIHEIHANSGKIDFIYQLPQIIYSTIISSFINFWIKFFSLSEKSILIIKKEKNKNNIRTLTIKTIKWLKIKFICFFIISFMLLLLFWYYLSCFCVVYKNTQYNLIIDTAISFGVSLLYPFGLNLLPGIFRIYSIKNPNEKSNKECLYKFSQLLQLV